MTATSGHRRAMLIVLLGLLLVFIPCEVTFAVLYLQFGFTREHEAKALHGQAAICKKKTV